jgi:molybdenum cofactor guanylyltransferase
MTRAGLILCGGQSSRMGRPKALLPWRGRTMIEHVVATLRQTVDEIVVVTSAELDLPPLSATVVRDREPKLGPLAGIREGLEQISADFAFVTSTDAPFLTPRFVEAMFSFGCTAAPVVDGFVQTLSAVYAKPLAPVASKLIAENRMRLLYLLEAGGYRAIQPGELPDIESIHNFNRPEEYLRAVRCDETASPVTIELLGLSRSRSGLVSIETKPGLLDDVLAQVEQRIPELSLRSNGKVAAHHLISLNGATFIRDGRVAIGPGDRLLLMDAAVGG